MCAVYVAGKLIGMFGFFPAQRTEGKPIPLIRVFKKGKFFAAVFLSAAGIWTLILIVMPTARWIYDGFVD